MTFTTKVQWFTTLTASYPEVQCHTAYQIVIFWYQSAHINSVLWLVRTGFSSQSVKTKKPTALWCNQLACRKSFASWGVQTVHLSCSKYQADVLCFYYYKYLTHACCTWVAYVSKISSESLQLLNYSKNGLIEALYTYCGSNKGGIQTNKR